jgi:hypothetical protein
VSFVAVDHLVVAARSLADGVSWCEATLGVTPGPGGQHPLMGTHNRLLKIASSAFEQAYLEIIAIDPDAAPPVRSRWFGMDTLDLSAGPRLIHVVGRSPMIDMHRWGLINVGQKPGEPVKAGRETPQGRLSWQILWEGRHPTEAMPDSGVVLKSLVLNGVPDRARDVLRLRGVSVSDAAGPALQATLGTPLGDVTLSST